MRSSTGESPDLEHMEKQKLLTFAVIGLLLLNTGLLAMLWLTPKDHKRERPHDFIIRSLQLDPTQQQQYEALIPLHRQQVEQLRHESHGMQRELIGLLKAPAPDLKKADSIAELIAHNRKEIELINFRHFSDIRALCRPEQQKLFDSLTDQIVALFRPPPPGK